MPALHGSAFVAVALEETQLDEIELGNPRRQTEGEVRVLRHLAAIVAGSLAEHSLTELHAIPRDIIILYHPSS